MRRLAAIAAAVAGCSAVLGPWPAAAFHDLECPPGRVAVDADSGQRRCVAVAPEAQEQFLRARQLQQEQERRTRALLLRQQQTERQQEPDRRLRELRLQQNQRLLEQEAVARRELARQQQFQREQTEQLQQPAIENDQAATQLEILQRLAPNEARRKAELQASELTLRQNLLRQQQALPTQELLDDIKNRRRRVQNQQEQ